ncbi:MAG: hypothetical protein EOP50_08405 [Sphingobacteriales bacterium]|nr:MAG: hypothetical protein EOP50_08405 [Sphingobacteriales bacterium]
MASFFCHGFGGTKQVRLERIVRPQHDGLLTEKHNRKKNETHGHKGLQEPPPNMLAQQKLAGPISKRRECDKEEAREDSHEAAVGIAGKRMQRSCCQVQSPRSQGNSSEKVKVRNCS